MWMLYGSTKRWLMKIFLYYTTKSAASLNYFVLLLFFYYCIVYLSFDSIFEFYVTRKCWWRAKRKCLFVRKIIDENESVSLFLYILKKLLIINKKIIKYKKIIIQKCQEETKRIITTGTRDTLTFRNKVVCSLTFAYRQNPLKSIENVALRL